MMKKDKSFEFTIDLIERARSGDAEALTDILKHYDARITALATYDTVDAEGRFRRRLDEDMKAELQTTLIYAIKNWRELI
jgi:tRNA U55 pseudouridine synthase TruB